MVEKNAEGKNTKWQVDSGKIHACAKCVQDLILKRMQGLGVEAEWKTPFRLIQQDGKYKRIVKGDVTPEIET